MRMSLCPKCLRPEKIKNTLPALYQKLVGMVAPLPEIDTIWRNSCRENFYPPLHKKALQQWLLHHCCKAFRSHYSVISPPFLKVKITLPSAFTVAFSTSAFQSRGEKSLIGAAACFRLLRKLIKTLRCCFSFRLSVYHKTKLLKALLRQS